MSKIIKLNEGALIAAGLPRDFIETMRHLVRQAGTITLDTTLPELANMTDGLTPIVNGLTITVTATNLTVSALETDTSEHTFVDTSIARRLNDMQVELERGNGERAALAREISLLRDDLGMGEQVALAETGATIRSKLGVSMLTGSNTGDQTLASLGAAAVAGSSAQAFAASTLTASDQVIGTKTYSTAPALKATTTAVNTASSFAATNSDQSHFLVGYSSSTADTASAIWWKTGTTLRFATSDDTQSTGFVLRAAISASGFKSEAGFGCNGAAPQAAYALGAASADLATVITLANNLRTMAINNGTGS